MKWLVALGLAFTFEIITSKCIKLFIVHFFGRNIDNDNYILIRKMVHDIFFSGIVSEDNFTKNMVIINYSNNEYLK